LVEIRVIPTSLAAIFRLKINFFSVGVKAQYGISYQFEKEGPSSGTHDFNQ